MGFFGTGAKTRRMKELIEAGAAIVDVRTPSEFRDGHVPGSKNLPLQDIQSWRKQFKSGDKVVLVCRSGSRSGMATQLLVSHGVDAVNGGPWQSVNRILV